MSIEHGPFIEPSQDRTPRESCPWNAKKVRSWVRDGEDFPKGGWGRLAQEETMTSLLKLKVGRRVDMPGVVESQSTCSPKKGIEVQSEGTRELELGSRRMQRAKEETGMLATVSLVHGTLTCGSLNFTTQEGTGAQWEAFGSWGETQN